MAAKKKGIGKKKAVATPEVGKRGRKPGPLPETEALITKVPKVAGRSGKTMSEIADAMGMDVRATRRVVNYARVRGTIEMVGSGPYARYARAS